MNYIELWVCECCMLAHNNGDTCDCPGTRERAEHAAEVDDGFDRITADGSHLADNSSSDEEGEAEDAGRLEFSWARCDVCGTSLGGARYRMALFPARHPWDAIIDHLEE